MIKKRVLIVGGGFGGVKTALGLCDNPHFEVTLLSDRDSFKYFPKLFHTASGGTIAESRIKLTDIFGKKNILLEKGVAEKLDRKEQLLITEAGKKYKYDILILALGSVPNFGGIKGIEKYSFNINTPEDARKLKDHLHEQLTSGHKPDLNYVVVGGGPTGIELAGALPDYLKAMLKMHGIKHRAIHIDLIEAAPALAMRLPQAVSRAIARRLRYLGVKVYLGKKVEGETADNLMVGGKPIRSHTVIWTAGFKLHPFFDRNFFVVNANGKVNVNKYLQAEHNIYVIGDNADTKYSGMAQTALHNAQFLSTNLKLEAEGKLMQTYQPKKPIYVIPVGAHWAATLWDKVFFYGRIGSVLRQIADFRAYKGYEPWPMASKQWTLAFEHEEECPICASKL